MNDHVKCCNCETEQVIRLGAEKCLNCGESGYLMWADDETQETEMDIGILTKTEIE